MVAAGPMRNVGGNMSRIMSVPAAVMGGAKVRSAAPAVTAASTAPTVAAASSATASSAAAFTAAASSTTALGKRDICSAKWRVKRKPERAETCGKSQDDKVFADRSHDVSFP